MDNIFGETIDKLRKERGWTMKELGLRVGKSESNVSKWIKGSYVPNMGTFQQLADLFGVTTDQLVYGLDYKKTVPEGMIELEQTTVPLLGAVSAGQPIIANPEYGVQVPVGTTTADYALRVEGDSMINAKIEDGDVVFIRQQEMVENGQIAAVCIDDTITLKRFYYYPENDLIILEPENPAYKKQIYKADELENIHILGKAVGLLRNF